MHYWDALPMVVYHALQCISRVHYYEIHCIVVCTTMQFQGALQCNSRVNFNAIGDEILTAATPLPLTTTQPNPFSMFEFELNLVVLLLQLLIHSMVWIRIMVFANPQGVRRLFRRGPLPSFQLLFMVCTFYIVQSNGYKTPLLLAHYSSLPPFSVCIVS